MLKKVKNIPLIILISGFLFWVGFGIMQGDSLQSKNLLAAEVLSPIIEIKEISGIARALDGDSVLLLDNSKKYEIRLINIDAPEYKQTCFDEDNVEYDCGKISAKFLQDMINGKFVTCKYKKKDMYNRFLGDCYLKEENINMNLVKNGMVILYSFNKIDPKLQEIEDIASEKRLGIWRGAFIEPRKYRKKMKKMKK
jgi:endonuclease YncB( thermonuclease family)